ncbi:MAG: hypothetical protein ACI4GY_07340, partial [Acutalibacteraceae bacterium]
APSFFVKKLDKKLYSFCTGFSSQCNYKGLNLSALREHASGACQKTLLLFALSFRRGEVVKTSTFCPA